MDDLFGHQYKTHELIDLIVDAAVQASTSIKSEDYSKEAFKRSLYYNTFVNEEEAEARGFDPMQVVTVNDVEHLHELGPMATLIAEYRKWMINERYGLSFNEWSELPKFIADQIVFDSRLETEQANERLKEIEREEDRKAKKM